MGGKRVYGINSKNYRMKILTITIATLLFSVFLAGSASGQPNVGSISGFKINDTNSNGKWDVGETVYQAGGMSYENSNNFIEKRRARKSKRESYQNSRKL